MKFYSLLLSCLAFLLVTTPAYAGKLMFWRFETNQNRLIFSTDQGVQPTAQLISNPTRLVIDLPGTVLGRPTVNENYNGAITGLRIGQFDARTTRLVIELAPGYTLDPQQIKIRGISPTQWTVDLPNPERGTLTTPSNNSPSSPFNSPSSPSNSPYNQSRNSTPITSTTLASNSNNSRGATIANTSSNRNSMADSGLKVTSSGLILGIDGSHTNKIKVNRTRNRRQINFELEGITLPNNLAQSWQVGQYGVSDIELTQSKTSALVTLNVDPDSPDWQATFSRMGGLVLWPQGGIARVANLGSNSGSNSSTQTQPKSQPSSSSQPVANNNSNSRSTISNNNSKTSIEAIELNYNQLIIKGNQKLNAQGKWNTTTGVYEIKLNNTDLASSFKTPQLPAGSPISRMRIWQPDGNTVILLIQPAPGAKINQLNQPSDRMLALSVTQYSSARTTRTSANNSTSSLPINITPPPPRSVSNNNSSWTNNPQNFTPYNSRSWQPNNNNSPRQSKTVVVIDPGHGGKDPGAVGIGGMQEKHVVMTISLEVARILEQQGIQVKLTRTNDYFISLQGRTEMANRMDADLFVSIHANSAGMNKPHVSGLETYYFQNGKNLATVIHRNVLRQVNVNDRKVKQARFYVLRKSAMPAVLVETGFVTGTEDAAKLKNPAYQKQMAKGIAYGIIEYIKANRL